MSFAETMAKLRKDAEASARIADAQGSAAPVRGALNEALLAHELHEGPAAKNRQRIAALELEEQLAKRGLGEDASE